MSHYAPTAEIITIGDEILYGQITDTNTQWISAELSTIGISTVRKSSVADNSKAIAEIIDEARQRASIIIFTGGLGPTKDDITKQTLAAYFGVKLVFRPEVMRDIEELFRKRNRALNPLHETQAYLPENAQILNNTLGTAPGMFFKLPEHLIFALPGVPYEMKAIFTEKIIPILKHEVELPVVAHRFIKTIGIPESKIALTIKEWEEALPPELSLAYLPSAGQVKLRLTGRGTEALLLNDLLDREVAKVSQLLQPYIYALEEIPFEKYILNLLKTRQLTLAVAESCTGGHIAAQLTKIDGASEVLKGGVVAYTNEVKQQVLQVQNHDLEHYTAVSKPVAEQMAAGVAKLMQADIGLSTTGVAGSSSPYTGVAPGTIVMAVASQGKVISEQISLPFNRVLNIEMASIFALNLLRRTLLGL